MHVLPSDWNLYTFSLICVPRFSIIAYAHNQPYISHTCSQANFHASATLGLGETYFIQNGLELGTASGVSYVSVI